MAFAGAGSLVLADLEERRILWHRYIAQVPYDVRIADDLSRVSVADKGGCVWSYSTDGALLWHHRGIPVVTDMDATDDGSRVAVLSHDGTIRMYGADGQLAWLRSVAFGGHNALDMTGDGRFIAVGGGTRENPYAVFVLDGDGNLLWSHSEPRPIPEPFHPYLISAMSVAISEDGGKLVAGYGTGAPGVQLFTVVAQGSGG